jgi:protein phosphatase
MKAKRVQIEMAMLTHVGRVRAGNEDAMGAEMDAGLFVVCDGMGGAAGGELASRMSVKAFLEDARGRTFGAKDTELEMVEAVVAANKAVHGYALANPRLSGMGTTLVALHVALTHGAEAQSVPVAIAHVGDSRCYRLRGSVLDLLTDDHSLVSEQVRMGELTPAQAELSPIRNIITRAVGSHPHVEVDVRMEEARGGDIYLLCSDGLTRELDDAKIAVMLGRRGQSMETAAAKLVEAANEAGGADNVTVVLVRVCL